MLRRASTVKDLAGSVHSQLRERTNACPRMQDIIHLFEAMYSASLKTEESHPVVFHVVYIDPDNPDPHPPQRIVKDRWGYVRFSMSVPATPSNLAKLAMATDPRSSSLAVYHDRRGGLSVWGLVDQGNSYHDFVKYDMDEGPERPGIFQASIEGPGHIVVNDGYDTMSRLKVDALTGKPIDALKTGPLRQMLQCAVSDHVESVKSQVPFEMYPHVDMALDWLEQPLSSLRRLLLRVQTFRQGGALLITPDTSGPDLNIKYAIDYDRLRSATATYVALVAQSLFVWDVIHGEYLEPDCEDMPVGLHLNDVIVRGDLDESRMELDGAIWLVSLLTRVDGAVLMDQTMRVKGFGVEITSIGEPPNLFIASGPRATRKMLREADHKSYGTRHRSVMRYCSQVPGSVGFVVSHDGDVRAIALIEGRLTMWENIRLEHTDFRYSRIRR